MDDAGEAADAIADAASADISRHFRDRYASLPRLIRESTSPDAALASVDSHIRLASAEKSTLWIEEVLLANALNGLAIPTATENTALSADHCPADGKFITTSGTCTNHHAETKAVPKHIQNGSSYTNTKTEAISALHSGLAIQTADNKNANFGQWLAEKYDQGKGRKEGPAPDRLEHLAQSVATVKYANQGVFNVAGNQTMYLHRFKKSAHVVFIDNATGRVKSIIPSVGKNTEAFVVKYKKRAP